MKHIASKGLTGATGPQGVAGPSLPYAIRRQTMGAEATIAITGTRPRIPLAETPIAAWYNDATMLGTEADYLHAAPANSIFLCMYSFEIQCTDAAHILHAFASKDANEIASNSYRYINVSEVNKYQNVTAWWIDTGADQDQYNKRAIYIGCQTESAAVKVTNAWMSFYKLK